MTQGVLVCGALAFDWLGSHVEPFHQVNLKLTALHSQFGGCGANIAYGLSQYDAQPILSALVGDDFTEAYASSLRQRGINTAALIRGPGPSARAFVFTGPDPDTQFTAFYPGQAPTDLAAQVRDAVTAGKAAATADIAGVVIAPAAAEFSLSWAAASQSIAKRLWAPGQYTQFLAPEVVDEMLTWANRVIVNREEWQMLVRDRSAPNALADQFDCEIFITQGSGSVRFLSATEQLSFEVPEAPSVRDPTGSGDAFTAGMMAGWLAEETVSLSVRRAVEQAQDCLRSVGAQGYLE